MPVLLEQNISGSGAIDLPSSPRVSTIAVHLTAAGPQVGWSWNPDNLHRAGFVQLGSYLNFGGFGNQPYWQAPLWLHAMNSFFPQRPVDGAPSAPAPFVQRIRWELNLGTVGRVWVFAY